MATATRPIRPLAALRLIDHVRNDNAPFLRLPREIRDQIYAFVLDEPILWNRRHLPTCSLSLPDAPGETPPWITALAYSTHPLPSTCTRRQTMGLLRVCKQISEEATDIFYEVNTFCFYRATTLVNTLHALHDNIQPKIQKLSLMQMDYNDALQAPARKNVIEALVQLPNLRVLDIGPIYFASHAPELIAFPSLTILRFSILNSAIMTRPSQSTWVYACRSRVFRMPSCDLSHHNHTRGDVDDPRTNPVRYLRKLRRPKRQCPTCKSNAAEFDIAVRQWLDLTHESGEPWCRVVEARLDAARPALSPDVTAPYILRIPLADGKQHAVKVWGLPRYTDEERRKRVVASKRALIVRRGPVPVCEGDEDDEGDAEMEERGRIQFRSGNRRVVESEDAEGVLSRGARRALNDELDELTAMKAAQKAKRNRHRSEREGTKERKAARKRV